MRAVVVGRGIGGLCMTSALSKLPFIKEITLIGDNASCYLQGHTGLWSPAVKALKYLTPQDQYNQLHSKIEFIESSGFTSIDGAMLAKPSTKPNLGFIRNSDLYSHLTQITNNVKVNSENDSVTNVNPINNEVTCKSGKKYQADLIVGADGNKPRTQYIFITHSFPN